MGPILLTALEFYGMALDVGYDPRTARTMVCIAKYESGFDTRAHAYNRRDKSFDHGILQINSVWANGRCSGLNLYNPYEALVCAKRVVKIQGFKAWMAYNKHRATCRRYIVKGA